MLWRSSYTWVVLWGLSGLLVLLSWSLHSFLLLWTLLNLLLFLFIFFSSIMMSFFTLRSLWVSHLKLQWKTIKFKFDTWNQQILSLLRFFLNNTLSINCPVNSEKMGDCRKIAAISSSKLWTSLRTWTSSCNQGMKRSIYEVPANA